jgi:hypothetical protein
VPAHEGPQWDYCQSTTRNGCQCAAPWWYEPDDGGERLRYNGTCGNPDDDPGGDWCFIVEGSCDGAHHWDYCGPAEPRCGALSTRFLQFRRRSRSISTWLSLSLGCEGKSNGWKFSPNLSLSLSPNPNPGALRTCVANSPTAMTNRAPFEGPTHLAQLVPCVGRLVG